eukprot:6200282-Pleurochrysis_carterae.AAC.2
MPPVCSRAWHGRALLSVPLCGCACPRLSDAAPRCPAPPSAMPCVCMAKRFVARAHGHAILNELGYQHYTDLVIIN